MPTPPTPLWELLNQSQTQPQPLNADVPNRPRQIDWPVELTHARAGGADDRRQPVRSHTKQWKACTDVSPVAGSWCQKALQLSKQGRSNHDGRIYPIPKTWVQGVEVCRCWTDLDLEFEVLRAVQAQPLAWVQPIQGALADYTPSSAPARRVLYDRYLAIAAGEGIPATTFQTHDTDPLFTNSFGHLSPRGWLYADRLLDPCWHGQLDLVASDMAQGGSVDGLFPPSLNCLKPAWCAGVSDVSALPGGLSGLPVGLALPVVQTDAGDQSPGA